MTDTEHREFDKNYAEILKEERRQKREFIASIFVVPLYPVLILLVCFIWNMIKKSF